MNNNFKLNKFWSLKDTSNYTTEKEKYLFKNPDVVRIFYFKKSFLLKVKLRMLNDEIVFVSPTLYISQFFPRGYYQCVYNNKKFSFSEDDIIEVIDRNEY
tara:strand:+ start:32 stop:331 length:300 start_codon:yes stop_codon:yes gene_type:complete